ncbi:hypothetical protein FACS189498_3800 [Spirochaetia bacterium]|nr:hypothetical protein FACS189498_3800 [Spirochaetia bacterium]
MNIITATNTGTQYSADDRPNKQVYSSFKVKYYTNDETNNETC